jgi:hypothetical protein
MRIECKDRNIFELTDGSETTGHLAYKSLFSLYATARVGNDTYNIKSTGIFNPTISITKNDVEIAGMKMNDNFQIVILFSDGKEYILKATGKFLDQYVLEDSGHQKLFLLSPEFDWAKFNYQYDVSYHAMLHHHVTHNLHNNTHGTLLLLLATYAANYCMIVLSSIGY